ncbi:MAG: sigma-54 dependent transcriptional regulator [Sedimenticola sp.]|uniref:Sigma-54-dependent Fis family transcriptional regulator n=1 Tax=Sedimenticola thiotaurini TaxID=1543721 RepID=A0A558DGR3_9GAMM|nr:sigma-54 dependent transcriptional regulator [Sedimenticola sp.]MCW8976450.1 sigma-54 dependent transcriptional regulator [Sedimenticola sp.]TVT60192.1 MAG: sigma-54-dependent Fis family transcriptional regulator [Sedimenticola thiotaurini]
MKKALIVDDDRAIRRTLELHLIEEGFEVLTAGDGQEGVDIALAQAIDMVLLDLRLPKLDGFEVLKLIKQQKPTLPVVMITAYDDMHTAIEAIRLGAFDHLGKPLDLDQLDEVITKISERASLSEKGISFCDTTECHYQPNVIVGRSKSMKAVYKTIGAVADTRASVLLYGESGTGKEMVARAIHYNGQYRNYPFIPLVCSSLAPTVLESELFGHEKGAFTGAVKQKMGKFELAHGGTLFLDEISEISPDIQLKLLRFLQEREFERVGGNETIKSDVRIITATNKDLATMVSSGTFRQDLYYRLKVVTIELPTLRERQEDIPLLVQYFMEKIRQEMGRSVDMIPEETMAQLKSYPWPGNVRELENALRRAVLLSPNDVLLPETLQLESNTPQARLPLFIKSIQELEKEHIENILQFTGFEKKRAAQILDISRPTLNTRIRSYGIEMPDK